MGALRFGLDAHALLASQTLALFAIAALGILGGLALGLGFFPNPTLGVHLLADAIFLGAFGRVVLLLDALLFDGAQLAKGEKNGIFTLLSHA